MKRVLVHGVLAALLAVVVTTLLGALAGALGVDFEVADGETIPLSGISVVTGFFSCVGVVLAAALRRWSGRPARRFVQATVTLTAVSLAPPVLASADLATAAALVVLHLVAAAVVIPVLARSLDRAPGPVPEPEPVSPR